MNRKVRGDNNPIDNVPMRFSDRYLAKHFKNIPFYDQYNGQDFKRFNVKDYKFTAELLAIEMFELHEKRRAEKEAHAKKFQEEWEKKHQKVLKASMESVIESSGRLQNQQKYTQPAIAAAATTTTTTASNNVFYNMFNGEILQPQPLEPKSSTETVKTTSTTTTTTSVTNGTLNTTEFENNDTNPFDNVELQSIDELKELNQLFQTLDTSQESNNKTEESHTEVSSYPQQQQTPLSTVATSVCVAPVVDSVAYSYGQPNMSYPEYNANPGPSYVYSPYQSSQVYRAPVPTAYCPPSIGFGSLPVSNIPSYQQHHHHRPAYTPSTVAGYVPSSTSSSTPYHAYSNQHQQQQPLAVSSLHVSLSQPQLENKQQQTSEIKRMEAATALFENSTLRSSKSVSDLTNMNNDKTVTYNGLHSSNGQLVDPNITKHFPVVANHVSLPDPYDFLSVEEKSFVDNLYQMGFQRDRVSRAVKHIGIQNERKLFEYLLTLQQLEDEGFHCYESEIALHMNNYNKHKAKDFLTSLNQICSLGFDKDAAIKALFKSNNDKNKAIEALYAQR